MGGIRPLSIPNSLRHLIVRGFHFHSAGMLLGSEGNFLLPHGSGMLIIPREGYFQLRRDESTTAVTGRALITGAWTGTTRVNLIDRVTETIILVLHPWAASLLAQTSGQELLNQNIVLSTRCFLYEWVQRVMDPCWETEGSGPLSLPLPSGSYIEPDPKVDLVSTAIGFIRKNPFEYRMAPLSDFMGYSRRYLQALFTQYIGLSPKEYAEVVRFQWNYRSFLGRHPSPTGQWMRGYADQSHLIREFRRFTGSTPHRLLQAQSEFSRSFFRGDAVEPPRTGP